MICDHIDHKGRQCIARGYHVFHTYKKLGTVGGLRVKRQQSKQKGASKRRYARREKPEVAFARAVKLRAKGRCEACAFHKLDTCDGRYAHAHHMVPKSRGRGWPYLHSAEANGLGVSAAHHEWIHHHPREAARLDLLRSLPVGARS